MRAALALALALALGPGVAQAERCSRGRAGVPVSAALTVGPADFGTTPTPCPDPRMALDLRASLLVDTDDFYGALGGEAVLSGVVPVGARVWLSGALTAARYRFVQNATLVATGLDLGPADIGVHVGLVAREGLRVSAYLRALLPTESSAQYAVRAGAEPGAAVLWQPRSRWSVLGGLSLPVEASFLGSRVTTRVTARLAVDGAVLLGTWFEPSLGVELRAGADDAGALEYVAPRASLRFHLGRGLALHLSGIAPLGGVERTDARFALGVAWAPP